MSRSFQIVEQKVDESEFFLKKILEASYNFNLEEAQYYLSAFLSASRSITFCIQASISKLPNFDNWYSVHQDRLKENDLAKYFLFARNHSQKVGFYPIGGGYTILDSNGKKRLAFTFTYFYPEDDKIIPKYEVIAACKEYFTMLLKIVQDCYQNYGADIDPDQYYTLETMKKLNLTIEDFEEELGFPRG
jgi:hypothetical protein